MNNPFDDIGAAALSGILARAVMSLATKKCPEIVESRNNEELRFLAFAVASAKSVDDAIGRLNVEVDRLGHVNTEENLQEFRVAIDKEVKAVVDAGLAVFRVFPVFFQAVGPSKHVH